MTDRQRRITILGLNFAPEEIGIGPYTAGLAQWLAERGDEVQVVAGRPYYPQWRAHEGHGFWWNRQIEDGVHIARCPHYIPRSPGGLKRLLHHASFALASILPMARVALSRPHIVLAIAPSLMSAPIALLAARISGASWWLHIQDFEVDAAVATGLIRKGSWFHRLGLAAERWLLDRADIVTTISPQMCEKLRQKGVPQDRITELRNWANHMGAIDKGDGEALRRKWKLGKRFVALYSGNIANKQGLQYVIEAAEVLQDQTDIAFIICGEGPHRKELERQAADLPNVQFHGLQPEQTFGDLMQLADCHLLPQLSDAADLVLPSKLANMLASGKPIIATAEPGSGIAREVEGCGVLVPPENARALAEAIGKLSKDRDQSRSLGVAAHERAQARWSKPSVLSGALSIVERLTRADLPPR